MLTAVMRTVSISLLRDILKTKKNIDSMLRLRAICGSTRFKIIILLRYESKGLTVTQVAEVLKSSLSKISHQMRILKNNNLITEEKLNREAVYRLNDHNLTKLLKAL